MKPARPRLISVEHIRLTRAEGPSEDCITRYAMTWAEATAILVDWSRTAPATGGYDKCDFVTTFADGTTCKGRYDLDRDMTDGTLDQHARAFFGVMSAERCPARLTPKDYARFLREQDFDTTAFQAFAEAHDLGSSEPEVR